MNVTEWADLLAWCTLLNYFVLVIWFMVYTLAHDWLYLIHARCFDISVKQFDVANYCGFGLYKLLIFIFNLAPYVALRITN